MKKLIFTLLLATTFAGASAQEVYKEIMKLSKAVANDKSKELEARKIATFKVDALKYMAMKTMEMMPDSTMNVLDNQAYALYDFVNLYTKKLNEAKKSKDKTAVLEIFKNASLQNKRFNDTDHELAEGYMHAEGFITSFSLDTDWMKATEQARAELRRRKL